MFQTGITRAEAASLVLRHLREGSVDTPDADARLLMQQATGLSHLELITRSAMPMSEPQLRHLENLLFRRLAGEPVGRLLGYRDFWGLRFELSPDTLEPRADSETLIEEALELGRQNPSPPRRILDLGTGSGCLLIALLSEWTDASGIGTDISAGALQTAARNAETNRVAERASFVRTSWSEGLEERFDLIISNPPYIATTEIENLSREVRDHDPARALDGGADGLDAYEAILGTLARLMKPDTVAILEIGAGQEADLRTLAGMHHFAVISTRRDLGGHVRAVSLKAVSHSSHAID